MYKYMPVQNETLRQKQSRFVRMTADLILFAYENGFELAFGHAKRCQDCKTGKKTSLHKVSLAVDLNLFKNGVYLAETEDHKALGEYWESLSPDAAWGGRFQDGNHYSLAHESKRSLEPCE